MRRLSNSVGMSDKLERALLACLNEKEYGNITIAELSRCAGINPTTYYLLFGSKDELFVQLCNSLVDQWFQRFFDLNISGNVDGEKELFHQLLAWIRQQRPALKRITGLRTETFDGFSLFTEAFERKMAAQQIFRTEDKRTRKKYDLFIRVYSVGLTSILNWLLDEVEDFDPEAFHTMIERLRYKGFYSIVDDWQIWSTQGTRLS